MSNKDKIKEEGTKLNKSQLTSVQGTAALGLAVTKHLLEHSICTVYLNSEGDVEFALVGETTMDALPEPMAIQELTDRGYDDSELANYLRGRDTRMGRG
jgi:hypothetical protein